MTRFRGSGLGLTAMLAGVLITGCTSTSAGDPRAADPTDGGDQPTGSTSTENTPTRPREIQLDDIDPCTLIPESDYSDYYIEESGKPEHNDTHDAAACKWQPDEASFSIILVTNEGIEVWLDGSRNVEAEEADPILDFPAVEYHLPNDDDVCFVAVDVAGGQYLLVQILVLESRAAQVPPPCEYAHQFAESAMSTLVKQKWRG